MHPTLRPASLTLSLTALLLAASPLAHAQAAAPAASTAPAPATYKITLSPALKVGQKFSLVSDVSSVIDMNMLISAPGMPAPQSQKQNRAGTVHLEADCEVLALTTEGQPKKVNLTIKSLSATQSGQAIPGLPAAGEVVVAEQADKKNKTLTVGGKPLDATLSKLIGETIPVEWDGRDDQIMFGPQEPVAIGATWSTNPLLLSEVQAEMPGASAIEGKMKLDGVKGSGDSLVSTVSGNLAVIGAQLPLGPGMSLPAQTKVEITSNWPVVAHGLANRMMKMLVSFKGKIDGPAGSSISVEGTANETHTTALTFP